MTDVKPLLLILAGLPAIALGTTAEPKNQLVQGPLATPTSPIAQHIQDAARRYHLDSRLVEAIVQVESNYDATAVSRVGAKGLMQLMDPTADSLGVKQAHHALNNLMGGCEYLRGLLNRYGGDVKLALAAYNAGPRNVDQYGGIPPFRETRRYVKEVLRRYGLLKNRKG